MRIAGHTLTPMELELMRKNGVTRETAYWRLKNGVSRRDAVSQRPQPRHSGILYKLAAESPRYQRRAHHLGISSALYARRRYAGWTPKEAVSVPPEEHRRSMENQYRLNELTADELDSLLGV